MNSISPFNINFNTLTKVAASDKFDNGYKKRKRTRMRERNCNCHKCKPKPQENENNFN